MCKVSLKHNVSKPSTCPPTLTLFCYSRPCLRKWQSLFPISQARQLAAILDSSLAFTSTFSAPANPPESVSFSPTLQLQSWSSHHHNTPCMLFVIQESVLIFFLIPLLLYPFTFFSRLSNRRDLFKMKVRSCHLKFRIP